jgi:hypothetical protein
LDLFSLEVGAALAAAMALAVLLLCGSFAVYRHHRSWKLRETASLAAANESALVSSAADDEQDAWLEATGGGALSQDSEGHTDLPFDEHLKRMSGGATTSAEFAPHHEKFRSRGSKHLSLVELGASKVVV